VIVAVDPEHIDTSETTGADDNGFTVTVGEPFMVPGAQKPFIALTVNVYVPRAFKMEASTLKFNGAPVPFWVPTRISPPPLFTNNSYTTPGKGGGNSDPDKEITAPCPKQIDGVLVETSKLMGAGSATVHDSE
jgi:hypothetical protein